MTGTSAEHLRIVQEAVAEAVGIDEGEADPDARVLGDLGAESIDLLDILFRIERRAGVRIQAADIAELLRGGLSDEEFEGPGGVVTRAGLEQLCRVLPGVDPARLEGRLVADDVMTLFTVGDLARMVTERAEAAN